MSNRSQAESIHLMLNEPSDWEQVLTSLNYQRVTEVDIYLGLYVSDQSEEGCIHQQWCESITGVIDTLKPHVLFVHHYDARNGVPDNLVDEVNQRQYLMQVLDDFWNVWSR